MKWLIKIAGYLKIKYRRKVSFDELSYFRNNNLNGAILLCFTPWQFTNLFIKGHYKHVEIVGGSDCTIGAVSKGVRVEEMIAVLAKCKEYAVLMPTQPVIGATVVRFAFAQRGKPYDSKFQESDDRFYCSELAVDAYNHADYDLDYGRLIYPTEFYEDKHNFSIVKEFKA